MLLGIVCGCGDPQQTIETLFYPDTSVQVTGVPDDVAEMIWGNEAQLRESLQRIVENPFATQRFVEDAMKRYGDRIAMIRSQKAYYQKYISASGIVIIGSGALKDAYFHTARKVVLGMTAKRPDLRVHIAPSIEDRTALTVFPPLSRRFRIVLTHPSLKQSEIPEVWYEGNRLGWFKNDMLLASMQRDRNGEIHTGFLIHEVAHVMHLAMRSIDATFDDRVRAAYDAVVGDPNSYWGGDVGNFALSDPAEYWAYTTTRWFNRFSLPTGHGKSHYTRFREQDPLLHILFQKTYVLIYLGATADHIED